MLSSKGDAKAEGRFATRLDVLSERVDTLASTVATTASAIAKKDGEIAALQRALEARDQTLQALVRHANDAAQAAPADVPVDETELRSLRNAVAALTKERAGGVNAAQIERLVATVRALAERVDALAAVAASPPAPVPDAALTARVDSVAAELAAVNTALADLEPGVSEEHLEERLTETKAALELLPRRIDELAARVQSGTAILADKEQRLQALQRQVAETSSRIESVAGELREAEGGVEAQLDARAAETAATLDGLAQRIDRLDARVDSGTSNLADKEQRLRTLERQLADSSSRIESIADELGSARAAVTDEQLEERLAETREALEVFAKRMDDLASGLDSATTSHADEEQRLEELHRQVSESSAQIESIADDLREALGAFPEVTPDQLGELGARIEIVEKQVATVAVEVARAKTLWPVALRSLEARLDDVATRGAHDEPRPDTGVAPADDTRERGQPEEPTDDLLAGLRDSLQAMETVAAELERTAEQWNEDSQRDTPTTAQPEAVAGGARVVPLRTTDP